MAYLAKDATAATISLDSDVAGGVHTPGHVIRSSALPTGAATSALQTTANTLLTDIKSATESTAPKTVNHAVTGIGHGNTTVTTAGTHVALAGSVAIKWVTVQAHPSNTGWIAVGQSGVDATLATGTGVLLAAGESMTLAIDNLVKVFVDATVSGEKVRWTYGN